MSSCRRELLETISQACGEEVVTAFVIVVECAGADGTRTLEAFSSDALGDAELPTWTAVGLLNYAIGEGMFEASPADYDQDDDDG